MIGGHDLEVIFAAERGAISDLKGRTYIGGSEYSNDMDNPEIAGKLRLRYERLSALAQWATDEFMRQHGGERVST